MSAPIDTAGRPRPVLLSLSVLAALDAITGAAGFAERIPAGAAWWIITGLAAVHVGLAVYLQRVVTPLADPRDARGVPLTPVDAAPQGRTLPTTTGEHTIPE
jgi:hypothetical protein